MGIGILQETKLMEGIYTRQSYGYSVWATDAESKHQGDIAVAWRWEKGWQLKGMTNYGSFMLTTVWKLWYVVGAYIPPNDQPAVHRVEQALARCPARTEILLVGDLNARIV